MGKKNDVFTMPLDALDKHVAALLAAVESAQANLEGLVALTSEQRRQSQGKFRDGEADALLAVLDAADQKPQLFQSLADKDFGVDPDSFETNVLRDRLQRASKLAPIAERLEVLTGLLNDTVLTLSSQTKPVMQQAYGIAKSVAKTDPKLRTTVAKTLDYYARIARKSAETRKKNPQPQP